MQLVASEVSADYYTLPPGLLMLTITYIQALVPTTTLALYNTYILLNLWTYFGLQLVMPLLS